MIQVLVKDNNTRVLALIPARGGSKGIPNKNITPLLGIPLIEYSIKAALGCNCIDLIAVSSDSDEILNVASSHGVTLIKRPAELASDTASSNAVIDHALKVLNTKNDITHLILLQPTSPLRLAEDIDRAWNLYLEKQPKLILSVTRPNIEIQKSFIMGKDGYLTGMLSPEAPFTNRQSLPDAYMPNGAIYICSVEAFKQKSLLPLEKIYPYEMEFDRSIDIDKKEDLQLAEQYLLGKQHV